MLGGVFRSFRDVSSTVIFGQNGLPVRGQGSKAMPLEMGKPGFEAKPDNTSSSVTYLFGSEIKPRDQTGLKPDWNRSSH